MRRHHFGKGLALTALLAMTLGAAACSSDEATSTTASKSAPNVTVVKSGFGQEGGSATAIVIATSSSPEAVGKFVTATVNFLDAKGEIAKTADQVESFSWTGQELVLPVRASLDSENVKVASIDVSVGLSEHGISEESKTPLAPVKSSQISEDRYGKTTAIFTVQNRTDAALRDLRVGVVCVDRSGEIIGGGSEYPSLIAAEKSIRMESKVMVSEKPAGCTAYPNYGV